MRRRKPEIAAPVSSAGVSRVYRQRISQLEPRSTIVFKTGQDMVEAPITSLWAKEGGAVEAAITNAPAWGNQTTRIRKREDGIDTGVESRPERLCSVQSGRDQR